MTGRAATGDGDLAALRLHLAQRSPGAASRARVQRKVLIPNDFAHLADVETRLLAFERRYEQTAAPFEWCFTRNDLAKLLERLADKPDYQAARPRSHRRPACPALSTARE